MVVDPLQGLGNNTEAIVRALKIALRPVAGGFSGHCPLPDHEDSTPSFQVYRGPGGEDRGWYCFGCGRGGDGASLVTYLRGVSRKQALEILYRGRAIAGLRARLPRPGEPAPMESETLTYYMRINHWLRRLRQILPRGLWYELARRADEAWQHDPADLMALREVYTMITKWVEETPHAA